MEVMRHLMSHNEAKVLQILGSQLATRTVSAKPVTDVRDWRLGAEKENEFRASSAYKLECSWMWRNVGPCPNLTTISAAATWS